jgi:branched-chain amino acid transport system substrate-binding protein
MLRRTLVLSGLRAAVLGGSALGASLLAGCVYEAEPNYSGQRPPSILYPGGAQLPGQAPLPAATAPQAPSIAILAPLSGPNAERGDSLVKAAQLALAGPGSPRLDVRDTGGTPAGAESAAQAAIAAGAGLIIGPLTAPETAAAAGPAMAAHVPVLAFTSDPAQARPGVWTLGITPGQQVRRMVSAVTATGKTRFAAVLPRNDFGEAMARSLNQVTEAAGLPPPTIRYHENGTAGIAQVMRDISQYDARLPPASVQPEIPPGAPGTLPPPPNLGPTAPPPFDALLLADTGERLAYLSSFIDHDGIGPPAVRALGPALWAQPSARAGATLNDAWFAAPDPASRIAFNQAYSSRYGVPASGLSDLAYDAASIARAALQSGGFSEASLTRPDGFPGVDGLLGLDPDGSVRRALALFEIHGSTAGIVEPAPASLGDQGT